MAAGGVEQRQNTDVHSCVMAFQPSLGRQQGRAGPDPLLLLWMFSPVCFNTSSLFSLPSLSLELLWFLITIFQVAGRDPRKDNEIIGTTDPCKSRLLSLPVDCARTAAVSVAVPHPEHSSVPRAYGMGAGRGTAPCQHEGPRTGTGTAQK